MEGLKLPPHSLEAEEMVLGAILIDNPAIAGANIPPEAFYVPAHQHLFRAMQSLANRSQPIDLVTLADEMGDKFETVGGVVKISELYGSTFTSVQIASHAAIIRQKWQRRKLIALTNTLNGLAHDPNTTWEELRYQTETLLTQAIAEAAPRKGLTPLSEILPEVFNQISEGNNPGTPLQIPFLDQCLGGGIRGGELIVVAGRPGMGKTFVGNYAARLLANQSPVCFFSMEMDSFSIVKRLLATEANLPQTWLTANAVDHSKIEQLATAIGDLFSVPIYVDDTPGADVKISHIRSECHKVFRQHNALGLIVVDYLQLIGDQGSNNRVGELSGYSSGLKSLAKEFNCPVIALSQLSRGVESRNDKRPVMSDIRGSGGIEQDADVVLMLYRDEYYNPDTPDPGILEVIIAKNRHGKAGVTAKLKFTPETGKIEPYVDYSMGV